MMDRRLSCSHIALDLLLLALFTSSCVIPAPDLPPPSLIPSPIPSETSTEGASDRIQIYFTDPTTRRSQDYQGGPDEILAEDIGQARLTVDVAAYSLNLWSIRDALIKAYRRGVMVRIVMESDNMDNQEVQQIQDAGIPVVGDQREGLMHNKFIVIDRAVVWTGSMNFTVGGAYRDNNNLVRLQSGKAAQDYTNEFEEMFSHHLFGPDTIVDTPYPRFSLDGTPIEVYFSPDDGVESVILNLIQNAQESIDFMAYAFTSNDIGNAIEQKAQAGVKVAGVMDGGQVAASQGSEYDSFMQSGLDVRLDGNEYGLMHHKVIIIDKSIIITGSYNFTASAAESNDENVILIFNSSLARSFLEEFQRVYELAQVPPIEFAP
jgi:phosphatidylserine/phosphatidylglycerophosphate/cardiolipin synthase-like enzyme